MYQVFPLCHDLMIWSILLDIQKTRREYWMMSTVMTPRTIIMCLGSLQMIRGIAMTIPMTGSKRTARNMLRFFLNESLKMESSLIFDNTPVND